MAKIEAQMKGADRVITGLVRLSFPYLFEKRQNEDGNEGKYEACLLISKDDKKTVECINKAIEAAKARGLKEKWASKLPKKLQLPLNDGDDRDDELDGFANNFYVNAKSKTRPNVVDKHLAKIIDPEEVYAGCYVIAAISFYPYNTNSNGIGVSLDSIMKVKDGEAFAGKPSAEADFGGIEIDDDDEDL